MAADFFYGLVKTISKTTKELGKTTKELGARAEQTIEAQKIRNKITGEERIIEKIKVDMGDIIYNGRKFTLINMEASKRGCCQS